MERERAFGRSSPSRSVPRKAHAAARLALWGACRMAECSSKLTVHSDSIANRAPKPNRKKLCCAALQHAVLRCNMLCCVATCCEGFGLKLPVIRRAASGAANPRPPSALRSCYHTATAPAVKPGVGPCKPGVGPSGHLAMTVGRRDRFLRPTGRRRVSLGRTARARRSSPLWTVEH